MNSDGAVVLAERANPLAHYPHARRVGDFIYVCGTSSRRPDNTHAGVEVHDDGRIELDIRAQTAAVFENIEVILEAAGAGLDDVCDLTVFLVDMDDFRDFNEVYNTYFDSAYTGPTRTTVAVHQLPHPNLLIEVKAIAYRPAST